MFNIARLVELHSESVVRWHREPVAFEATGIDALVLANHEINFRLWHEEDDARDPVASDTVIANVKRRIDRLNQQRSDSIEKLDVTVQEMLLSSGIHAAADSRFNTETLGSVLDRLSILSLRIYHLAEQIDRPELEANARSRVSLSLELAKEQRKRLAQSADELCIDIFTGRKRHQPFRQLKMYNDPVLNPVIYNSQKL